MHSTGSYLRIAFSFYILCVLGRNFNLWIWMNPSMNEFEYEWRMNLTINESQYEWIWIWIWINLNKNDSTRKRTNLHKKWISLHYSGVRTDKSKRPNNWVIDSFGKYPYNFCGQWDELLEMGQDVSFEVLHERAMQQAPNVCCSIVQTVCLWEIFQ